MINYQRLHPSVGLSEETLTWKSPFVPGHPLGIPSVVAPHPSFQRSYYSELASLRHLGCNEGLGSDGTSLVMTAPSSGAEDLQARSVERVRRKFHNIHKRWMLLTSVVLQYNNVTALEFNSKKVY